QDGADRLGGGAGSGQPATRRGASRGPNPKSEIRNPKQIPIRQNEAMTETANPAVSVILSYLDFEFVSDFEFRISDLGLPNAGPCFRASVGWKLSPSPSLLAAVKIAAGIPPALPVLG